MRGYLFKFSEAPLMLKLSKCLCFWRVATGAEPAELWAGGGRSSTGVGSPLREGMLAAPSRKSESAPALPAAGQVSLQVVNNSFPPLQKRDQKGRNGGRFKHDRFQQ